ncbi:hypothetical protein TRFO_04952 [Tritrichomonas foetus]|uniref:Uncharacterized protein n=1 Tax=Tritrichomonas foetus TaxID=1144522 RepID=A0A1J4KBP5_9EUKA|nr:hypothetical protein TRFO_04952 [Tritrichomonas foetus]|eukprot:OHT08328.1 hypothetical protein TRFO_04952 [Tritrichomonas foetus]
MNYKKIGNSSDTSIINKYQRLIFSKLDINLSSDEEFLKEENSNSHIEIDQIQESLIRSLEESAQIGNELDLEESISAINSYLNKIHDDTLFPLLESSNALSILITQLNRNDYLDNIKMISCQCLHKILLKFSSTSKIMLELNIINSIFIILRCPITPTTLHALLILINIFTDFPSFIPELIKFFTPAMILNLFKETRYEKGFARLVAASLREKIIISVTRLFLIYSTIQLELENCKLILMFFDSILVNNNQQTNNTIDHERKTEINHIINHEINTELSFLGIQGIVILFANNGIDSDYLNHAKYLSQIFPSLIEISDFSHKIEIIDSYVHLVNYGLNLDISQINLLFRFLLVQSEEKGITQIRINIIKFLLALMKRNGIHFIFDSIQFNLIELLCNFIENASFNIVSVSIDLFIYILSQLDNKTVHLIFNEQVTQAIAKIMMLDNCEIKLSLYNSISMLFQKCQVNENTKNEFLSQMEFDQLENETWILLTEYHEKES